MITDNLEELFDVVDENNNVVGKATRGEVHTKGLWHRAIHVLILNSKKEILLQKRSMTKELYKGYWIDTAGHVDSGESYEETAKREMKEEIGIDTELEHLFDCTKYTGNDNEFIRVFLGHHDGPFEINKNEMDFVKFFPIKKIFEMIKTEKITPGTLSILKELEKHPELLKRLMGE